MNQEDIRKLFKKYDVDFEGRKYLSSELINKKIIKKTIRNFISHQGDSVSTIYCLLKGSVEIFYTLARQKKEKLGQNIEQQEAQYKSPRYRQQKIVFSTLEGEFELINDQALLGYLQIEERKEFKNKLNKVGKSKERQYTKRFQTQKKNLIKSRYSSIVTSSECQYIELTFLQSKALLRERIQYITKKEIDRQKVIKQTKGEFLFQIDQKEQQSTIEQLEKTKSFTNSDSPNALPQKTISSKQTPEKLMFIKQELQKSKNQTEFSHPGKRLKSISLISFNHTEKKIVRKDEPLLPLLNNFKNQLQLFNQNQLILQKYRQKKAFEKLSPAHQSNEMSQKTLGPILTKTDSISDNSQDRLFKQNLKKIIRKKLNFQKKYGQTIKQSRHVTTNRPKNINFEQLQFINQSSITMQKSSSIDKLKNIQIKTTNNNNPPKSVNTFQTVQKKKLTLIKNKFDSETIQQPINEFIELQKMKKKLQQESLFLKLQNLDSYFDKIK